MNLFGRPRISSRKRAAFTLIELLVVIAIIAILAAILFPVFAQAKAAAKKTADLSNMKQLATAVAMYTNDADDLNPLETGMDSSGNWDYDFLQIVPADWYPQSYLSEVSYSQDFVMNTLQAYVKNWEVMAMPGAPPFAFDGTLALAAKPPQATAYAYNGLLTAYPSSSVAAPSQLPLFTGLNGFQNFLGYSEADPILSCPIPNVPCSYVPPPAPGTGDGTFGSQNGEQAAIYQNWNAPGYWCNGKGQNWSLNDTHVKWQHIGAVQAPGFTDYTIDPMTLYDGNGLSLYYYVDPSGNFPYLFRPDFDFNFATGL